MQNQLKTICIFVFCFIIAMNISILAQEDDSFIKLDQYGGQKVPKSLLTPVSIDMNNITFE